MTAGAIAFALAIVVSQLKATPYDNYVLLADAFAHGRLWIDWPGTYIDAVARHGRYYVIEAPLPAVLLLPFVALFGPGVNQGLLGAVMTGVAIGAFWEIATRFGTPRPARFALAGFFSLGTDLLWCATFGDVWLVAHLCAVASTMLALLELTRERPRGALVALFAAAAAESRFSMALAVPLYAAMLATDRLGVRLRPDADGGLRTLAARSAVERRRSLALYAAALVPVVALAILYDEGRWGVPYDIGYVAWYHQDPIGEKTGSPFRFSYVRYELRAFFARLPDFSTAWPYAIPKFTGVALTWTSPALALVALARGPRPAIVALWALALATFTPSLFYYIDGYAQFGMRHALDFEPFLVVLMAVALRRPRLPRYAIALVAFSMLAGAWGIWYWKTFYRT